MMTNKWLAHVGSGTVALLLLLTAAHASAQMPSGTISGRVTGAQDDVLSGVTVTLVSQTGEVNQITDAKGQFRFLGLAAGTYDVRTMMRGFRPSVRSNLAITVGRSIDLTLTLEAGDVTAAVTPATSQASVDTVTSATGTAISRDLLFSMPVSRINPAVDLINYAPGINSGSAFGGASGSANSLLFDGVSTHDPAGGTAQIFLNYNTVDQVHVGSIGQAAEVGGFTGAVAYLTTRAGSNRFSGLFEQRYSSSRFRGDNVSSAVAAVNPAITAAGVDSLKDSTAQMGGPIRENRAFFFASIQRYAITQDPDGPRTLRTDVAPRLYGKLTVQPSAADTVTISAQYNRFDQKGQTGLGGTSATTDARSIQQNSPDLVYTGRYRRALGHSAVLEARVSGYSGSREQNPRTPTSARLDGDTGEYSGGAGFSAQHDRTRNQLNASLAKYAEAKGTHAFKFGVEIERSTIRNRFTYTDGLFFYDYGGAPYLAYAYQYDVKGRNDRLSVFAQDQWQAGRLTVSAGARMDRITGTGSSDNTQYYKATPVAPRLGAAYDISGDGKSVLRAYYGQLYDGAAFASWSRALPGIGDFVVYDVAGSGALTEIDRIPGASKFTVLDGLKHPRTDEVSVTYERELGRGVKVTGAYIRRDAKNFINSTLIDGQWAPASYSNPLNHAATTIYRWTNRTADQKFQIGNVDNFPYNGAPAAHGYRKYSGGMLVVSRAYANRWQAQVSYVYSTTRGTVTNGAFSGVSSGQFETPNTILVNTDGLVDFDRTHELKVFAGYQIPIIDVSANAYYRAMSGRPWTPYQRVGASTFNWTSSLNMLLEPMGSRRNETARLLDLRVEKVFNVGTNRLGVYVDAENVFNTGFETAVQTRYPSAKISGTTVPLGGVTSVTAPRQFTFGGRWSF